MKDKELSWDERAAGTENLTFQALEQAFRDKTGLLELDKDIQTVLNLYRKTEGYTHAGLLVSDQNPFPGLEIIRFGKGQNEILSTTRIQNESLISIYKKASSFFELFYTKEVIQGLERKKIETVPVAAFCEVLTYALVQRNWSDQAGIRILMTREKIEIVFPYKLAEGMDTGASFRDFRLMASNPCITYIFFRLGLIEQSGMRKIQNLYRSAVIKPSFDIEESVLRIQLPVLENLDRLSMDQQKIFLFLKENGPKGRFEIEEYCGFSRSKTANVLRSLLVLPAIGKTGSSRSTKYFVL